MATPHPYAEILRAIADGQQIQWETTNGKWQNQSQHTTLHEISEAEYAPARYRIAPRTITVNGIEVPEPEREPLQCGEKYYTADPNRLDMYDWHEWANSTSDFARLVRGLVHLPREAAIAHAEAMIAPSKREKT